MQYLTFQIVIFGQCLRSVLLFICIRKSNSLNGTGKFLQHLFKENYTNLFHNFFLFFINELKFPIEFFSAITIHFFFYNPEKRFHFGALYANTLKVNKYSIDTKTS